MYRTPIILFGLLDVGYWRLGDVVSWADAVIGKLDRPRAWVTDLCFCRDADAALLIVREVINASSMMLPDNVSDLLVGLILHRYDNGDLSDRQAVSGVFDVIDAYGSDELDAEAIESIDLLSEKYLPFREKAGAAIDYVMGEECLNSERIVFEY